MVALAAFTPGARGADTKTMGKIRHIVLLHLKDAVSAEQQKDLQKAADKLRADVETVQTLELGKNLDSNTRNDGYTECLFVTFKDEAGHTVGIETYTLQFTMIGYTKSTVDGLLEQLDAAFNWKALTVTGMQITPIRTAPLIVFDTGKIEVDPVSKQARGIFQGVSQYRMDFDFSVT